MGPRVSLVSKIFRNGVTCCHRRRTERNRSGAGEHRGYPGVPVLHLFNGFFHPVMYRADGRLQRIFSEAQSLESRRLVCEYNFAQFGHCTQVDNYPVVVQGQLASKLPSWAALGIHRLGPDPAGRMRFEAVNGLPLLGQLLPPLLHTRLLVVHLLNKLRKRFSRRVQPFAPLHPAGPSLS